MRASKPYMPFGFDQGDPLIVCANERHMKVIQEALQVKAYYCLPGSMIGGRRHSRAVVFITDMVFSDTQKTNFMQWMHESVMTRLEPGGKIYYV